MDEHILFLQNRGKGGAGGGAGEKGREAGGRRKACLTMQDTVDQSHMPHAAAMVKLVVPLQSLGNLA